MHPPEPSTPPLPSRSQPLIAVAVAVCLAAAAVWFVAAGGPAGGLVHHDVPPAMQRQFAIDINTADETELAQLPGLGTSMARRIVDHRSAHGPFSAPDDLLDVPGIGPTTLDRIRPYLRSFSQPVPSP